MTTYKNLKIYRDEKEDQETGKKINNLIYIISLIAIVLIPNVLRIHQALFYSPSITGTVLHTGNQTEIFDFWKLVLTIIYTITIACLFILRLIVTGEKIKWNRLNISLFLFLITVIISFLVSPYKSIAFIGYYARYFGTVPVICFLIIFFVLANSRFEQKLSTLIYALIPFILINFSLGLADFFHLNTLNNPFMFKLILGNISKSEVQAGSHLLTTLYQGNTMSGVASVLLSIFLFLSLVEKNVWKKTIFIILTFLNYTMIMTSDATSGFVTAVVLTLVILFVLYKLSKLTFKSFLIIFFVWILFLVESVGMSYKDPQVWQNSFGFFIKEQPTQLFNSGKIKTNNSENLLNLFESKAMAAETPKFNIPTLPKEGVGAGSGRVYIWKHALKLIEKKPLFGYGLNTFPFEFNENDPQKYANIQSFDVIVDKPHNMYLDFAYGSGLIGLLLFLYVLYISVVNLFRNLKGSPEIKEQKYFITLVLGILAFLFQGIFNDFFTGNAIFFWVILAVLLSHTNGVKREF